MNSSFSFVLTPDNAIGAVIDGKNYHALPDHPAYHQLLQAVRDQDPEAFVRLWDVKAVVQNYVQGSISVVDGVLYYRGEQLDNSLVARVLDHMYKGIDPRPLLRFLENLLQNPSYRAVKELYGFLTRKEHYAPLPLTEDGHFLAYKTVRPETYKDWYSNTFDNHPGNVISMERNTVDDNWAKLCSSGFHVGTLDYIDGYNRDGQLIIVKINPKDVVSVPDHGSKCRVCRYEVLCNYTGELPRPVYPTHKLRHEPYQHGLPSYCEQCGTILDEDAQCPQCDYEEPDANRYCGTCGAELSDDETCPVCDAEDDDSETCRHCAREHVDTPFCPGCGARMED